MEWLFFWFVASIVIAVGASSRGRSGFGWFVLSLAISPILSLVALALTPNLAEKSASTNNSPTPDTHVKCPDCAELVLKEARVCKHCGCRLIPQA